MIASDSANPDFVGAHNPDARLAVRFYSKAVENAYESSIKGRPIFYEVDYVEIRVPGDTTTAIDTPAREDHKQRFPMHWARYQNSKGSADGQEIGTPLDQWPLLSKAQAEELRALKYVTVDQVATASDAQLQRIGMIAGMSPYAFRERAQRFLKVATDDSFAKEADERAKALEEKNTKLEQEMAVLQAQVAELAKPKARGRPKKAVPSE